MTTSARIQRTLAPPVIRYVITYLAKDGLRTLFGPCQGQNTSATKEEAESRLIAILQNNNHDMLQRSFGFPLEVCPCECWPSHFDPMGRYFDSPEGDRLRAIAEAMEEER